MVLWSDSRLRAILDSHFIDDTMTPVSDIRKMSLMPDLGILRSQSDTSYASLAEAMSERRARRASDWSTVAKPLVLRPLHLDSDQPDSGSLLHRRLSKAANRSPSQSSDQVSREVSRSLSVRSVKKSAESKNRHRGSSIPSEATSTCNGVKVKERTVSNRSLPLPGDESEYLRLRNFSITSKGVVNRGDSFRSKSNSYIPDLMKPDMEEEEDMAAAVAAPAEASVPLKEDCPEEKSYPSYKVLLVGGPAVGKTAMKNQFMTSEYICAYDFSQDHEHERTVTVVLNNEESQMEFEEELLQDENGGNLKCGAPEPDAYVVVYSVTNRRSYLQAKQILSQIEEVLDRKAVILVGNKTDLARLRTVTTDEGKSLAKERGCKFIETSVAINHQVDELLVGILTQIRIKAKVAEKLRKKRESTHRRSSIYTGGAKASSVLKKILRRACIKSKSCDNLHVL